MDDYYKTKRELSDEIIIEFIMNEIKNNSSLEEITRNMFNNLWSYEDLQFGQIFYIKNKKIIENKIEIQNQNNPTKRIKINNT
jgi:hypothetical protein